MIGELGDGECVCGDGEIDFGDLFWCVCGGGVEVGGGRCVGEIGGETRARREKTIRRGGEEFGGVESVFE